MAGEEQMPAQGWQTMKAEAESISLGERHTTVHVVSRDWFRATAASVIVLVYLAHTLRNLTPLYVIALGLTYIFGLTCLIGSIRIPRSRMSLAGLYGVFIAYSAYVAVWSVLYLGRMDILGAIGRLFVGPLIAAVLYPFLRSEASGWRLIHIYLFVFVVAVCTYVYQFATGPISWFNEPGAPRGGLARFATNLGSLTIYGTAVGVAFLFVFGSRMSIWLKVGLTCVLLAGCAFSVQKAAFVNVGLAALGGMWLSTWKSRFKAMALVSVILLFLVVGGRQILGANLTRYVDALSVNTIGVSVFGSNVRQDDSLSSSRITERVYRMVADDILINHDPVIVFTMGIGLIGGGGGMGMDAPQAHNSLWDLLLMGGVGYLVVFLLLYYKVQQVLLKSHRRFAHVLFAANVIFLFNATASSAHMFHPITSFPFWLSLVVAIRSGGRWVRSEL